ncbi:MAG: adenylate kinase [Actinobacteria bacterium]|nr:adenylate kinase [Actinomycetota bacterium]
MLGLQGAGKGTQGKRIAAEYGVAYIGTGDMLRAAMAQGTELGRRVQPIYDAGELVPDEFMIGLIQDRISEDDAQDGFLLDGFPRTIPQADALDAMLAGIDRSLSIVFELQIPDELAVERLLRRAREEGRADDTPQAIARRIEHYHSETEPLVSHYRARGALVGIHAARTINEVFAEIQEALEQLAVRE